MSKLNNNSNYYSLRPGMGFSTVLEHFKKQSRGQEPDIYLKTGSTCRRRGSGLRYISLATESNQEDMPKMEVIDPNEAVNKRAASQLKKAISDKTNDPDSFPHSASGPRKRRTTEKQHSTASKIVRRAKDLFDN